MHDVRDAVDVEHLAHHALGEGPGLAGVHPCADDVPGVDVDHHVGVVVDALDWAGQLRDVPGVDLPGAGGDQLGTGGPGAGPAGAARGPARVRAGSDTWWRSKRRRCPRPAAPRRSGPGRRRRTPRCCPAARTCSRSAALSVFAGARRTGAPGRPPPVTVGAGPGDPGQPCRVPRRILAPVNSR